MSVLNKYFDKSINQCSPVQDDFARKVNYDEDGNEFVVFEKVDNAKLQKANGKAKDWSLNALISAGISPDFPIHTGYNTRLDGIDVVNNAVATLDAILAEENENKE